MSLQKCHECGKKVSTSADRCMNCGAPVVFETKSKTGCLKVIFIVFVFLLLISALNKLIDPGTKSKDSAKLPETPPAEVKVEDPFLKMTDAEHLEAARKALLENYVPNKDPMKTQWGNVAEARKQLDAIKADSKEFTESRKLTSEVERREKEIEKVSRVVANKLMVKQREEISKTLETEYLKKGMDVHIRLSGTNKTVMRLEYILMSRPLVYKIANETDFLESMEKIGFKKVIFSDGYNYSWSYNLGK